MKQRILENGSPTRSIHVPRWPWHDEHIHYTWRDVQRKHFADMHKARWSARAWILVWSVLAGAVYGWLTV